METKKTNKQMTNQEINNIKSKVLLQEKMPKRNIYQTQPKKNTCNVPYKQSTFNNNNINNDDNDKDSNNKKQH